MTTKREQELVHVAMWSANTEALNNAGDRLKGVEYLDPPVIGSKDTYVPFLSSHWHQTCN